MEGLAPDCSNSSALTLQLLQSGTKPLIYSYWKLVYEYTKGESDNEGPWLKIIFHKETVKKIWAAMTEFSQETENFHPWYTCTVKSLI